MQLLDLQKGNQSVDAYLRQAKAIADSLISINKPVSDEDLVIATLHGLGPDYGMLHTALTQNPPLPDFSELRARILSFEAQQIGTSATRMATALFNHTAPSPRRDHRSSAPRPSHSGGRYSTGRNCRSGARPPFFQQQQYASFPQHQQQFASQPGPFSSPAWVHLSGALIATPTNMGFLNAHTDSLAQALLLRLLESTMHLTPLGTQIQAPLTT
ncbi:uncharacterized protein LOC112183745 [Rosa chinensis]|uniref:uncharacterized protein LOC112183745 n=1 Tax=Rosa chinensis TaxID=74649 RepID=UPI000D091EB3|nr:uncharacterized protein LOC112183745 [Rosa chinensis]